MRPKSLELTACSWRSPAIRQYPYNSSTTLRIVHRQPPSLQVRSLFVKGAATIASSVRTVVALSNRQPGTTPTCDVGGTS